MSNSMFLDTSNQSGQIESLQRLDQPIFLVGSERSGTTLCRLMLDHHPQITWCNEFEYAVDLMSDDPSRNSEGWPDLDEYYQWLSLQRIFRATGFKVDPKLSYPDLVNSFLVQRLERHQKPIVGATVHRHFDRLVRIWPNAKFIHIVRDPRDVAKSCIGMGWAGNVWKAVERWITAEKLWDEFSAQLPADRKLEVVYSDLVTDVQQTLETICDFIGVKYSPAMLTYPEHTEYDLPDPKLVAQWHKKLTPFEIRLVESRVGRELLTSRGFEHSDLPELSVTPLLKKYLLTQDRYIRWRYRINYYGFWLLVGEMVTRKLHLKKLHRPLRLKMNAIMQSRIKKSLTIYSNQ